MTVGAILGFLISNGPSLIGAGTTLATIVSQFFADFGGKDENDPVTPGQFDEFIGKCLGDRDDLLEIIERAKADIAAASAK